LNHENSELNHKTSHEELLENDELNIYSNGQSDIYPSMEHVTSETEPTSFLFEIPVESSPKNNPQVSTFATPLYIDNIDVSMGYTLPHRYNCGKPPNRYSLEMLSSMVTLTSFYINLM